jgi:hypothetical protein
MENWNLQIRARGMDLNQHSFPRALSLSIFTNEKGPNPLVQPLSIDSRMNLFYFLTTIASNFASMRRFFCRPSAVLLLAIGLVIPYPLAVRRAGSIPNFCTR